MTSIEPGEKFSIEYGNGHTVEVVALNMRQRRALIKLLAAVQDADPHEALDSIEEALRCCFPAELNADIFDELVDSLDEEMAMEIVQKTMEKQRLSEDERGKSE